MVFRMKQKPAWKKLIFFISIDFDFIISIINFSEQVQILQKRRPWEIFRIKNEKFVVSGFI